MALTSHEQETVDSLERLQCWPAAQQIRYLRASVDQATEFEGRYVNRIGRLEGEQYKARFWLGFVSPICAALFVASAYTFPWTDPKPNIVAGVGGIMVMCVLLFAALACFVHGVSKWDPPKDET